MKADETWFAMALVVSNRSRCDRSAVGCVIVSRQGRIVSTGYNGAPAGLHNAKFGRCTGWCPLASSGVSARESAYDGCPTIHAEANALLYASRSDVEGGRAYVTRVPCHACALLLANSGLRTVVFPHDAEDDANRTDVPAIVKLLVDCGLTVVDARG